MSIQKTFWCTVLIWFTLFNRTTGRIQGPPFHVNGRNDVQVCNTSSRHEFRFLNDLVNEFNSGPRDDPRAITLDKLTKFILSGHERPDVSVREAVKVALLRLGFQESMGKCRPSRPPPHEMQEHDLLSMVANRIISQTFGHNSVPPPSLNEQHLVHLTQNVMISSSAITQCCLEQHAQPRDCSREDLNHRPHLNKPRVFGLMRKMYSPNTRLDPVCDKDKYMLSAYQHRLECFDEDTLELESRLWERESASMHNPLKPSWTILLLRNILYGLPMRVGRTMCPVEDLNDVFRKYSDHPNHISLSRLQILLNDLEIGNTSSGHGAKRNAGFHGHGNTNHPAPPSSHNGQNGNENGHNFVVYSGGSSQQHHTNVHKTYGVKCLSAADLFAVYGANSPSWYNQIPGSVNMFTFKDMCPTILNQLLTGVCKQDGVFNGVNGTMVTMTGTNVTNNDTVVLESDESIETFKTYLYSSLAVFVISLCSLTGALFVKLSRATVKTYLMASMLSLAVGCLIADAVLHLLPEILEEGDHATDSEGTLFNCNLKRLCVLLASLYGLFVMELLLSGKHEHGHHGDSDSNPDSDHVLLNQVMLKYIKPLKETNLNNELPRAVSNNSSVSSKNNEDGGAEEQVYEIINTDDTLVQRAKSLEYLPESGTEQEKINVILQHSRDRNISQSSYRNDINSNGVKAKQWDIKPVAWMIIIGDCIHNFADGLAIGAAFSLSFTKGLSTSFTVLCHEVPHELGDFAVLIDSGLSIKKAMLLNFLSSLTAFAGLYAGLSIGSQEEATKWIFAVGTGLFLYVALTDLVPECKEYFRKTRTATMFIAQNVGMILGFSVMLLLALYESRMELLL